LFFKWIKQHLQIKKFLGNIGNSVKTDIWCAMSANVPITIVKKELQLKYLIHNLLHFLSILIFEKTEAASAFQLDSPANHSTDDGKQLNLFTF
jgi:hypothetical protein